MILSGVRHAPHPRHLDDGETRVVVEHLGGVQRPAAEVPRRLFAYKHSVLQPADLVVTAGVHQHAFDVPVAVQGQVKKVGTLVGPVPLQIADDGPIGEIFGGEEP